MNTAFLLFDESWGFIHPLYLLCSSLRKSLKCHNLSFIQKKKLVYKFTFKVTFINYSGMHSFNKENDKIDSLHVVCFIRYNYHEFRHIVMRFTHSSVSINQMLIDTSSKYFQKTSMTSVTFLHKNEPNLIFCTSFPNAWLKDQLYHLLMKHIVCTNKWIVDRTVTNITSCIDDGEMKIWTFGSTTYVFDGSILKETLADLLLPRLRRKSQYERHRDYYSASWFTCIIFYILYFRR